MEDDEREESGESMIKGFEELSKLLACMNRGDKSCQSQIIEIIQSLDLGIDYIMSVANQLLKMA